MRKRFLASVAALVGGAGLAFGQAPAGVAPADPAAVPIAAVPPPGGVMPVAGFLPDFSQHGKEALYLHSGAAPGADFGAGAQHGRYFPWCLHCGDCAGDKCGFACAPEAKQAFRASGGPDCFYFDLEWMLMYFRAMPIAAPMISAGPIGSAARPGVDDGARVLFGQQNVDFGPMNTLKLTMGLWDSDRICGIEASAFLTEQRAEVNQFFGPIDGRTVLARPVTNVLNGVPESILISSPPGFGGSAGTYTASRAGGAELNFLRNWCYYDRIKFNTLFGVRWMALNEQLRVDSNSVLTDVDPADPPIRDISDSFTTRNNFYGLNFGFRSEFRKGRWFTDMTAKVALGFTHEKLNQSGFTRFVDQGIETVIPYGAYVLEPNSGRFSEKDLSALPEFNIKFGYQWSQRISTYIGYDIMYLSNVVRPGDQVNPNINPTLLPISNVYNPQFPFGPPEPALLFKTTDFTMQGLTLGLSIRY